MRHTHVADQTSGDVSGAQLCSCHNPKVWCGTPVASGHEGYASLLIIINILAGKERERSLQTRAGCKRGEVATLISFHRHGCCQVQESG